MQRHGPPFCTALGFLVAFIVLCVLTVPAHAAGQGNVNFILGQKALDEDDWTPPDLDTQRESGVEVTWGGESWPIQIATDFLASTKTDSLSGVDVQGTTWEWAFGVRKIWEAGPARPYLGGGLALVNVQVDIGSSSPNDSALGTWIGGGVFWRLGSRFNIGLATRLSKATGNITNVDFEAGGLHYGLILGWGWPATR